MALAGALAITSNLIGGFSNKTLRPLVAAQLDDQPYGQARCSYDLRRLRLKGLMVRIEHSNTYVLTDDGQRFAIFYTKVHNRLLRPLLAGTRATSTAAPAPSPPNHHQHVEEYIHDAHIPAQNSAHP